MLSVFGNKEEKEQEGEEGEEKAGEEGRRKGKVRGGEGEEKEMLSLFCLSSNQSTKPQCPASLDSLCVAQSKVLHTGTCVCIPTVG